MFDLKAIRENPDAFDAGLARRGLEAEAGSLLALDEKRRALQTEAQTAQARRNEASKQIGLAKREGREDEARALMAEVGDLKARLAVLEEEEQDLAGALDAMLLAIPNLPYDDVPAGEDENGNVECRTVGTPPQLDFAPKEHFELGEALGLMDFERAVKLSGSRFVVLKGALARLERALGQFMLDVHTTDFGYEETVTPALVRSDALLGTGQLPKFADDQFRTTTDHWLIPTAEVTLTNLHAGEILDEAELPKRSTALTQCFRAEAGAAGRDTRGMIRQHQFAKVELVSVVAPEDSDAEHQRMTEAAETVLKRLDLPYRVMELCDGDMGFSARRTFDIEVWLPGQGRYREISSCSVCGDFQARRMKLRCRARGEKKTRFPHTLNGSGVAVGRALIAVMENYQRADGGIDVPVALRPYMAGLTHISGTGGGEN